MQSPITNIDIAARLKALRGKRTQNQVANGIGIKRGAYQAYEEKRALPPLPILQKLAEYYDLHSLDKLLGITEGQKSQGADLLFAYQCATPAAKKIVDIALNYNC